MNSPYCGCKLTRVRLAQDDDAGAGLVLLGGVGGESPGVPDGGPTPVPFLDLPLKAEEYGASCRESGVGTSSDSGSLRSLNMKWH